jgi:hypothetical protein
LKHVTSVDAQLATEKAHHHKSAKEHDGTLAFLTQTKREKFKDANEKGQEK